MLGYRNQTARYAIGTSSDTATLTAAYAGNVSGNILIGGASQVILACYYTPEATQSNRNMSVKVEFSYDGGTVWVPLSKGQDATPASNIIVTTVYDWEFQLAGASGGTTYYQRVPVDVGDYGVGTSPLMRVSVKEDGATDFGTAKVIVVVSGI